MSVDKPLICWLSGLMFCLMGLVACGDDPAAPETEAEPARPALKLTKKWVNLFVGKARPQQEPLPDDALVVPLEDLQFTGPKPGHPFILGEFATDATWAVDKGLLQPVEGKNAALRILQSASDFELEGAMLQEGLGGWFLLIGWEQEHGYVLCNATMKTAASGSPWFIAELRGGEPIEETIQELPKFDWQGGKTFRMKAAKGLLTLQIGNQVVLNEHPIPNNSPGDLIVGAYDTKYGPKKLGIKSLRVRAVE